MQLNLFKVDNNDLSNIILKFDEVGLQCIHTEKQSEWTLHSFFSQDPTERTPSWLTSFNLLFPGASGANRSFSGAIIASKEQQCFIASFGKSHFYIRPFCDYDFGIELAKRIADGEDASQTSARRFQGKQRKNIKSYAKNTRLSIPPGESVDFIQASITNAAQATFGPTAKFGTSALLSPPINPNALGRLLDDVVSRLSTPELFQLPRTVVISDDVEVRRFDELLIKEIQRPVGLSDFTENTFDLFGVDFIFNSTGNFRLKCGNFKPKDVDRLTMREVKEYVQNRKIPANKILSIKISKLHDDEPEFTSPIKDLLDYIHDKERVVLSGGRWLQFNQDYLQYLNESVDNIPMEPVEDDLKLLTMTEPEFNIDMKSRGYTVADKDFELFKVRSNTPIEAWDLKKGSTVYAVKFGTPQKLNYVCDQAMNLLELFHNRAEVKAIPDFDEYCLWLGYRGKTPLDKISSSGSIILKQKIEAWARRCEEIGIKPKLKLSQVSKV